jgi:hypothetical protein
MTIVGILTKLVAGDPWTDQERQDAYAALIAWGQAETATAADGLADLEQLSQTSGIALASTHVTP